MTLSQAVPDMGHFIRRAMAEPHRVKSHISDDSVVPGHKRQAAVLVRYKIGPKFSSCPV